MNCRSICAKFAAGFMLLAAGASFAAEQNAAPVGEQEAEAKVGKKSPAARRAEIAAKRKANAKVKLVDINSASQAELMKLPAMDEATANKIIAGRPYGSKAWLVTQKVIPDGVFQAIKNQIIAKQPFKSAAEVDAAYGTKK